MLFRSKVEFSAEDVSKGDYPHYMLKEIFEQPETIRDAMRGRLSREEASAKLGGLGMAISGFGFNGSLRDPSSEELANAWRPWIHTCLELFGPKRCMFESNFPADRASYSYLNGWNAMKMLARGLSPPERHATFYGSAAEFYRLDQQLS